MREPHEDAYRAELQSSSSKAGRRRSRSQEPPRGVAASIRARVLGYQIQVNVGGRCRFSSANFVSTGRPDPSSLMLARAAPATGHGVRLSPKRKSLLPHRFYELAHQLAHVGRASECKPVIRVSQIPQRLALRPGGIRLRLGVAIDQAMRSTSQCVPAPHASQPASTMI